MVCVLGDNLIVRRNSQGNFMFTIDYKTQIILTSYEMSKFMYLIRSYISNRTESIAAQIMTLSTNYKCNKENFVASIWLNKKSNGISMNVLYSKKDQYKGVSYDQYNSPSVSTTIPYERLDQLVREYISYEYRQILTDD